MLFFVADTKTSRNHAIRISTFKPKCTKHDTKKNPDTLQILIRVLQERNIKLYARELGSSYLDLSQLEVSSGFAQSKQCIIYVDSNLNVTIIYVENNSPIWECLFVFTEGNKANIDQFRNESNPILSRFCEGDVDNSLLFL